MPVDRGIELAHDVRRRSLGRDDAVPRRDVIAGIALLRDGRHIGRHRRAFGVRHAERPQFPGLDVGQPRHDGVEVHRHLARQQGRNRFPRALVRHVHDVDARHRLEHFPGHVRGGAGTERRIGQLAWIGLGVGHHFGQRPERQRRMRQQDIRRIGHHRHLLEGIRVVAQLLVEKAVGHHRGGSRHQQRIAVARCAGHRLAADHRGGAGLVFDHEALAIFFGQGLAQLARDQVGSGAGVERHHDPDRLTGPCGIGMTPRRCGKDGRRGDGKASAKKTGT